MREVKVVKAGIGGFLGTWEETKVENAPADGGLCPQLFPAGMVLFPDIIKKTYAYSTRSERTSFTQIHPLCVKFA